MKLLLYDYYCLPKVDIFCCIHIAQVHKNKFRVRDGPQLINDASGSESVNMWTEQIVPLPMNAQVKSF